MVGLEVRELGVELTISDPRHEVAQLKQNKVNIGYVVAHQELLVSQEICDLASLLEANR